MEESLYKILENIPQGSSFEMQIQHPLEKPGFSLSKKVELTNENQQRANVMKPLLTSKNIEFLYSHCQLNPIVDYIIIETLKKCPTDVSQFLADMFMSPDIEDKLEKHCRLYHNRDPEEKSLYSQLLEVNPVTDWRKICQDQETLKLMEAPEEGESDLDDDDDDDDDEASVVVTVEVTSSEEEEEVDPYHKLDNLSDFGENFDLSEDFEGSFQAVEKIPFFDGICPSGKKADAILTGVFSIEGLDAENRKEVESSEEKTEFNIEDENNVDVKAEEDTVKKSLVEEDDKDINDLGS